MNQADRLIEQIIPLLTKELLELLAHASLASPIARLKIYYYDTHAPSLYLLGYALTVSDRHSIMANEGPRAVRKIWCDDRTIEVALGLSGDSRAKSQLDQLYELMAAQKNATLSRRLATQLCISLNAMAWPDSIHVADEFIAYPTNGTDRYCDEYEDICASVPGEKLATLQELGLMGKGERNWDTRENFPTKAEFISKLNASINSKPIEQRVSDWIRALDSTFAGTDPDFKMMGIESEIPLHQLTSIGPDSAMPLLMLASKWAERIEEWEDGWNPTDNIPDRMYEIIEFVSDQVEANNNTHKLLSHVLMKSQQYPHLGLSFACCNALHKLFNGYPAPKKGQYPDYRPGNLVEFTSRIA